MKTRLLAVVLFAVAVLRAEAQTPCDLAGTKDEDRSVAYQMEITFEPPPSAKTTLRFFDEAGLWLNDRDVVPSLKEGKATFTDNSVDHAFYPEKYFVAATGARERSTLCVPGRGTKAPYAPCTGQFALELTQLKPPLNIVIEAPKAAEVSVTMELPRPDGGVCKRELTVVRGLRPTADIKVGDGENIRLAVKGDAADKTQSAGCRADVAHPRADLTVPVRTSSPRNGASPNQDLVSQCQLVKVRLLK